MDHKRLQSMVVTMALIPYLESRAFPKKECPLQHERMFQFGGAKEAGANFGASVVEYNDKCETVTLSSGEKTSKVAP
jgi:hypothetical protein